jgi:hypothetical protein
MRLDGRDFHLHFLWNMREQRWYLDIFDTDSVPLAVGLKLISNQPLLRFYQWDPRLPPGELLAYAQGIDQSNPGFNDFGEGLRVELVYYPTGV